MQLKIQLSWISSNIIKNTNTNHLENSNMILTGGKKKSAINSHSTSFAKFTQDGNNEN